jgi:hypothetical protein
MKYLFFGLLISAVFLFFGALALLVFAFKLMQTMPPELLILLVAYIMMRISILLVFTSMVVGLLIPIRQAIIQWGTKNAIEEK